MALSATQASTRETSRKKPGERQTELAKAGAGRDARILQGSNEPSATDDKVQSLTPIYLPILSKIAGFILASCIVLIPVTLHAGLEVPLYWKNFGPESDGLVLSCIFPAPKADCVFINAETAVRIESVVCDGKVVTPSELIPAGFPDMRRERMISGSVIYQFPPNLLRCWATSEKNDGFYVMHDFRLPEKKRVVEVKYRIRYPDDTSSGLLQINFVEGDAKIQILRLQGQGVEPER